MRLLSPQGAAPGHGHLRPRGNLPRAGVARGSRSNHQTASSSRYSLYLITNVHVLDYMEWELAQPLLVRHAASTLPFGVALVVRTKTLPSPPPLFLQARCSGRCTQQMPTD